MVSLIVWLFRNGVIFVGTANGKQENDLLTIIFKMQPFAPLTCLNFFLKSVNRQLDTPLVAILQQFKRSGRLPLIRAFLALL